MFIIILIVKQNSATGTWVNDGQGDVVEDNRDKQLIREGY